MNWRQNRYDRENIQRRVAAHVRDEKKLENIDIQKLVDNKIRHQGKLFFERGLFLEDAPDDMRNNSAFIEGYENARNRKTEVYDMGVQYFIDGVKFKDISTIYQNNKDFMQGYNDARDMSLIDDIDWNNILGDVFEEDVVEKGKHR